MPDNIVHRHRRGAQGFKYAVSFAVSRGRDRGKIWRFLQRRSDRAASACHWREHFQNIADLGDDCGTLLKQTVAACSARIKWRSRYCKDDAAHLVRKARADQRSGSECGFHDDESKRDARDQSRLRRGKSRARGSQPNGISDRSAPRCAISSARVTFSGG